jgi:thiamine biosynthesis lipoprotein ApbE
MGVFCVSEENQSDIKSDSLSEEAKQKLKEQLNEVDRQLRTMDWDKQQNQFNAGMEEKYSQLKAQHENLAKKLAEECNSA